MSEYLDQEHEHDYEIFNHKKIRRNKIVEVCQSTGQPITQGEVDDYNAAAKRKPIQLEFDFGEGASNENKR